MSRRLVSLLGAFVLGAMPVSAATCPDGSQRDAKAIAAAIDVYASNPFSARTWRVLKALGDPGIEYGYGGSSYWADQERWRKWMAEIAPDV